MRMFKKRPLEQPPEQSHIELTTVVDEIEEREIIFDIVSELQCSHHDCPDEIPVQFRMVGECDYCKASAIYELFKK